MTDRQTIRIHARDNVVMAVTTLPQGQKVVIDGLPDGISVTPERSIGTGHKLAAVPIRCGEPVIKYGLPIGTATVDILPGQHVHTHNLKSNYSPTFRRGDDALLRSQN